MYNKAFFKSMLDSAKEAGVTNGKNRKEFLNGVEYIVCNCIYIPRKDSPITYGLDIENFNNEMLTFSKCHLINSEKEMAETYEVIEPVLKKIFDSGRDAEFIEHLKHVVAIFFQEDDCIDGVDVFKL